MIQELLCCYSRIMKAFKFFFVAVLAVSAFECNAFEIDRSATSLDLRLFVENGAVIAKNIFKAINTGLDQSKPNVEKILNELAPEAKTAIRKIIDKYRGKFSESEKRVEIVFATLNKALNDLKPIKPCSDKFDVAAKKLFLATERNIVKIVQEVKEKFKKEINNVELGSQKILNNTRVLFDTKVPAVVKCLTPGRKDATSCLFKEIDQIKTGVVNIISDSLFLAETANKTLAPAFDMLVEKMIPVLQKFSEDGKVLLKTLSDCVATLK